MPLYVLKVSNLDSISWQINHLNLPMTYKGVVVSLNPLKIPCMAKERSTAGAPKALNLKYLTAGISIGESYKKR